MHTLQYHCQWNPGSMSDSSGKAFYTKFVAFASGFLQLLWSLENNFKRPYLTLEKAQGKNNNLPQQHAPNGIFIRGLADGKRHNDIHTSTLKVSDEYQEVLTGANIDFIISQGDSKFRGNGFGPS